MGVKGVLFVVSGVVFALIGYIFLPVTHTIPQIQDGWYGKGKIRSQDNPEIKEFKVNIPQGVLDDLKERLAYTRFADPLEEPAFEYGFHSQHLEEVVRYWREEYDWRKYEAILNSFPQYTTQIEGLEVHFIRVQPPAGPRPGSKPVLIVHGWPGSVWEFYKLIPRLTEPEKFGGRAEDALEVICPSIPGYGFSEKPHQKGFSQMAAARIFTKLMSRLGYEEFYLQGGDWGAAINVLLAQAYPSKVLGVHLNMIATALFDPRIILHQLMLSTAPSLFLDQHESAKLSKMSDFVYVLKESGYMHIQATRPDTVGTALNDSPAGLAAYILEKFSAWTNPAYLDLEDGGLTKKFTMDELLTNVMIYWTTGTITSSQRFYKEYFRDTNIKALDKVPVTVPTGMAEFPNELLTPPQALLSYKYPNILQYTIMPDGGHFAAFEQPELLANDFINFVRKVKNLK